jgi:hypothetical protein
MSMGNRTNRVRTVLECPWIWKQKFKPLNVLEFVKKYLKILKFFLYRYFLQYRHWFCMLISDKAVWNSLKLRLFWTIHDQRHILLISNAFSSVYYLVLDTWMSLESPWIWVFLPCTNLVSNTQAKPMIELELSLWHLI